MNATSKIASHQAWDQMVTRWICPSSHPMEITQKHRRPHQQQISWIHPPISDVPRARTIIENMVQRGKNEWIITYFLPCSSVNNSFRAISRRKRTYYMYAIHNGNGTKQMGLSWNFVDSVEVTHLGVAFMWWARRAPPCLPKGCKPQSGVSAELILTGALSGESPRSCMELLQ